jgi:hypothetical protein
MPRLDMNNRTPEDCQAHVQVLWTLDPEEIISQIILIVNPR